MSNKNYFTITGDDANLMIDRVRLVKGSVLVLDKPAPRHWSRFGVADIVEPEMVVATPSVEAEAQPIDDETRAMIENAPEGSTPPTPESIAPVMPGMPGVDDEDALRAEYTECAQMLGKEDVTADKRWGVPRLRKELDTLKAEING